VHHTTIPDSLNRHAKLASHVRGIAVVLACALFLLAGCGDQSSNSGSTTGTTNLPGEITQQQYGGSYSGGTATGDTQSGASFARWVLDQDPGHQYITDSVVRNEQSLGVKVQPTVTKADLQRLMEALAQGMARTFPGKDLQVIAFYQSGDKLAVANYQYSSNQVAVQFLR